MLCRPNVHFHCDINYDPFVYMHENNKTYGSFLSCLAYRRPNSLDRNATQGSPSRCTNTHVRSSRYGPLCAVRLPLYHNAPIHALQLTPPHVDFITEHPEYVVPNNAMGFLSDNDGADYNLCHCTSVLPPPRTQGIASDLHHRHHRGGMAINSLEQL